MDVEVCVVGGGPAGATIAARLATLGHDVVVVERAAFPREHVGESLSPGVWPLLAVLGVDDVPCLRPQSRVRWGGVERMRAGGEGGAIVDRGALDALLLDTAAAAGAQVLAPAGATLSRPAGSRPPATGEGWDVSLRTPEGVRRLHAGFLVDAGGRRRVLAGARHRTSPRTLCLHARWCGAPLDEALVEERPDCWLWGAPLPGGTFRAMAFVDPVTVCGAGGMLRRYPSVLAGSELFARLVRDGRIEGDVHACDASSFVSEHVVDERSIRVGEAAFAIDPLSSSGVQVAVQTALAAATAVHTILTPDLDSSPAIEFYADQVRHAAARHERLAAGYYADGPGGDAFWRERAGEGRRSARDPIARAELGDMLGYPIRLVGEATIADIACVIGDRVERRRAIAHPVLDRPVAFLGGHELVPLVVAAGGAPTLRAAIEGWCATGVGAATAEGVARWLADNGLIERDA